MLYVRFSIFALTLAAAALLPGPAHALSGGGYLKLRRQNPPDPRLSIAQVKQAPELHTGKVLELKGTADGYVQRDSEVCFMLNMPGGEMHLFVSPPADSPLIANPNRQLLRVLARVKEPKGDVADFAVLGIALDGEVTLAEREEALKPAASPKRAVSRPAPPPPSRTAFASRSGAALAAASGSLSALAQRVLSPEAQAIYPHYRDYIQQWNQRLSDAVADQITVSLLHFAQQYQVDPRLAVAMICAESDFRPHITSHKGAMGLGQIMPDEARSLQLSDPYDPIQNIYGAIRILRGRLDRYNHSLLPAGHYTESQIKLALAAYNAGPGAVRKYGGVPPYKETQRYVQKVLTHYRRLCGF